MLPFAAAAGLAAFNVLLLQYSMLYYQPVVDNSPMISPRTPSAEKSDHGGGFTSSWEVFWALVTDRFVLAMCGIIFVATCVKTTVEVILPLFLQNQMGAKANVVANTWFIFGVFFIAASMIWGHLTDRKLIHPVSMMLQNLLILGVSTAMVFYWRDVRTILSALALFGIGLGGTVSPSCAALTEYCESHPKLRDISEDLIVAVFNDFWAFGLVFGTLLAGIPNEFDEIAQIRMLIGCGVATLGFACVVAALPRTRTIASPVLSGLPGGKEVSEKTMLLSKSAAS